MRTEQPTSTSILRLGGIAGIIAVIFLPGVALQMNSGWFPEENLTNGTMLEWLNTISTNSNLALLGISFSTISILTFLPFILVLYRHLPEDNWRRTLGLASYLLGATLALVAFTFAFGFTWAMIDAYNTVADKAGESLAVTAASGMRSFLVADDLATSLIGIGHFLFAWAALRSATLPKWLCWWGIIGGFLVILVLLRYTLPIFNIAQIGYPIVILWFVFTGINLLRKIQHAGKKE